MAHRCLWRVVALWESLQVELQGQLSVARLKQLHEYNEQHSLAHAVGVTLFTPLPCIVVVALIECIPLRPVEEGLASCQNFWIRNIVTLFIATSCFIEQMRFCIQHVPVRGSVVHSISLLGSAVTVYAGVWMARLIGFPLPFAIPLSMLPWIVLVGCPLWLSLRSVFQQHPDAVRLVRKYALIIACQLSLILVYSLYGSAFANLTARWQLLFSLGLPLIKVVEKNLFARVLLRDAQDLKPEIVVFNVEVFNALFTAICMQQATTIYTSLALIAVDFVQACISLRDLDGKLMQLQALTARLTTGRRDHIRNVFAIIISDPEFVRVQNERTNSVPTGIGAAVAASAAAVAPSVELLLQSVRVPKPASLDPIVPNSTSTRSNASGPSKNQVAPASAAPRPGSQEVPQVQVLHEASTKRALVLDATFTKAERHALGVKVLEILYLTEFLLLIEFVEVMIPFVYCVYMYVLFHLPNRTFYPNMRNMDAHMLERTTLNVFAYAAMEFVSFVLLGAVLRRKLCISPLHHLAFVLERQWRMVQSKLVLWVIYSLQTSIEHFGMDFTFKFAWLHKTAS